MNKQEYEAKRRELIDSYNEEIWEHESAGCFGDAENARKWLWHELDKLEREYKEGGQLK